MPRRLAAILALLAFAVCLIVGGMQVGNPFTTTVGRALVAMGGTFVVGLAVGAMGKKMIDENLPLKPPDAAAPAPVEVSQAKKPAGGR